MFVAESLQDSGAIENSQRPVAILHLQEQAGSSRASNVERLIASFIPTLDASTHSLITEIAVQLPSSFRHLFNVHDWLHECVVTK